jgi:hemerythrin
MTKEEHKKRHQELHKALDELAADIIKNTDRRPSQISILELIEWSHQQTINPDHV